MDEGVIGVTGKGRAESDKELTLIMTIVARCAMQIWSDTDDAELAMNVLARGFYAPSELPPEVVLAPTEMIVHSDKIAQYVAEHPLPPCDVCDQPGVAQHGGEILCWRHYDEQAWREIAARFGQQLGANAD